MCYRWFLRFPDVPFLSEQRRRRPRLRVAGPTEGSPFLSGQTVDRERSRIEKVSVLTGVCCTWRCQQDMS
ncbi:hypothetical protein HanXRQr2_Chr10g0445801 [Helianthus annuus]|uniref:Uncharacterized protein n=1 Tax=Helianthus annuus TaxID=4232 RepID=A0A9K3HXS5_HELAN|nr:hypothetical protein HanXRQr2_Chr10g0445801 [Helianthus annuus]